MPNNITLAKKYVPVLDEIYKKAALSEVLDGDNGLAREGANVNEIIIPKIDMDGMGNYSRANGYANGAASLTWETVKADYDRGRMFNIDYLDDEESMNVAFGRLAGEFMRTKAVPEMDAWTFAKIAGTSGVGGASAGATLSTGAAVSDALIAAINALDEAEAPEEDRILFITPTLLTLVRNQDTTKSREALERFGQIVRVPQTRFYSGITLYDGTTEGQTAGGFIKTASTGKDLNFIALSKSAICKFHKHVAPKIISPEANQHADGYMYGYRHVAVCKVYDNKLNGVYVHHK